MTSAESSIRIAARGSKVARKSVPVSPASGAPSAVTGDAVAYLGLSALCLLTLLAVTRYGETAAPVAAER